MSFLPHSKGNKREKKAKYSVLLGLDAELMNGEKKKRIFISFSGYYC